MTAASEDNGHWPMWGGMVASVAGAFALATQLWHIGTAVVEIKLAAKEVQGIKETLAARGPLYDALSATLAAHGAQLDTLSRSAEASATVSEATEARKTQWMADVTRRLDATELERARFFAAHPNLRLPD